MKKFLALLLIFATLISLLVACAETDPVEQQTDAVSETEEILQLDNIPADLKYNGEDIVVISRSMQGWTQDEVAVPELAARKPDIMHVQMWVCDLVISRSLLFWRSLCIRRCIENIGPRHLMMWWGSRRLHRR